MIVDSRFLRIDKGRISKNLDLILWMNKEKYQKYACWFEWQKISALNIMATQMCHPISEGLF
jgi:hypothetical protein